MLVKEIDPMTGRYDTSYLIYIKWYTFYLERDMLFVKQQIYQSLRIKVYFILLFFLYL